MQRVPRMRIENWELNINRIPFPFIISCPILQGGQVAEPGEMNPAMTGNPSEILRRVLKMHPEEILNEPEQLMRVLMDYFPRAEVNLLISAARAGIPRQVVDARPDTPPEVLLGTLRNRMTIDQGFSRASAEWVVQAWFGALRSVETVPGIGPKQENLPLEEQQKQSRPTRLAGNIVMGGIIAVGVLFFLGLFAYRMLTEPPYTFESLYFFEAAAPETLQWELRNFNAWCKYPAMECAMVVPFKVTSPYVQARLGVAYSSQRAAEAPVHCSATNSASPVVVSADATGNIPDPMYPKLMRTGWMIPFKAPELGWTPGSLIRSFVQRAGGMLKRRSRLRSEPGGITEGELGIILPP